MKVCLIVNNDIPPTRQTVETIAAALTAMFETKGEKRKDQRHETHEQTTDVQHLRQQDRTAPISGWAGGNNARPINDGRCCDNCDNTVVIPQRIAMIYARPNKEMKL